MKRKGRVSGAAAARGGTPRGATGGTQPADATVRVSVVRSGRHAGVPAQRALERWAAAALGRRARGAEISLLVVGAARSRTLNRTWRGKDKPTNVLSFPPGGGGAAGQGAARAAWTLTERGAPLLGDLVICPPVLRAEARAQHKSLRDHWAHLFVHGLLHLLGHDHEQPDEARRMERREVRVLRTLGIANPYRSL